MRAGTYQDDKRSKQEDRQQRPNALHQSVLLCHSVLQSSEKIFTTVTRRITQIPQRRVHVLKNQNPVTFCRVQAAGGNGIAFGEVPNAA